MSKQKKNPAMISIQDAYEVYSRMFSKLDRGQMIDPDELKAAFRTRVNYINRKMKLADTAEA